jgi:hypothetical protein
LICQDLDGFGFDLFVDKPGIQPYRKCNLLLKGYEQTALGGIDQTTTLVVMG